jgi:hypothetical protein
LLFFLQKFVIYAILKSIINLVAKQMNNLGMNKKTWIILAGVILIIAGGLFLYSSNKNQSKVIPIEITTDQLAKADIPTGLPQNLPTEAGSKVLQNYESRTNDGRLQSTRQITSKKSAQTALSVYVQFFKDLGWSGGFSESSSTANGQQIALMQKDQDSLMIVATPKEGSTSEIEFTLIQKSE